MDGRLITTESRLIIQPYAACPFKLRKKAESIIIQGDVVLHLLSASTISGDIYGAYTLIDRRLDMKCQPKVPTQHEHHANFRLLRPSHFLSCVGKGHQVSLSWMQPVIMTDADASH